MPDRRCPKFATEPDGLSDHRIFEASEIRLRDLDLDHMPNLPILYGYDFGDCWKHQIKIEAQVRGEPSATYPACIGGERHGPPEDAGGPVGYANFLEAWDDPHDPEHRAMRQWAGRGFMPDKFDLVETNRAIARALRLCRGDYRFRHER